MNLREKAMLASLKVYGISGTRQDKKVTREVEQSHNAHDVGMFYKRIFAKGDLSEIYALEGRARSVHAAHTLPWYDQGPRLLPAKNFDNYTKAMNEIIKDHDKAVDEFIEYLDEKIEAARERLNGLFNPADYPDIKDLKHRMRLVVRFDPIPNSEDFRLDLNDDQVKELQKQLDERKVELEKEMLSELWGRLKEVLEHVYTRLSDDDPKFRSTLTTKIDDLVKSLPLLNVSDDKNLNEIVKMTEKKLGNLSADDLRHDDKFRTAKAKETKEILDKMANYFTD